MGLFDKALAYTDAKKAGTFALLQNWGSQLEAQAKQNAPWTDRTAHARQAIHGGAELEGDRVIMYLAHGVEYGGCLEEGTPPHIIRPVNAKALYWPGAPHPYGAVNHPGTKKYPIIKPTMDGNEAAIRESVLQYWRDDNNA